MGLAHRDCDAGLGATEPSASRETPTPCVALGGLLFVTQGSGPSNLHKYSIAADEWSIVEVEGYEPHDQLMVHVRGFLWFYQGYEFGDMPHFFWKDNVSTDPKDAGLRVFRPEQGTHHDVRGQVQGASPPSRTRHGYTAAGDRLYVFGGVDAPSISHPHLNDPWMPDAAEGSLRPEAELVWTELSVVLGGSAPVGRSSMGLAALGGRIFIFGGYSYAYSDGNRLA